MKIQTIKYRATAELHGDSHEALELVAELEEGENLKEKIEELKIKVHENLTDWKDYMDYKEKFGKAQAVLADITFALEEARKQYEVMKEFLASQGIKDGMPGFPNLALRKSIEGEIIIDDSSF